MDRHEWTDPARGEDTPLSATANGLWMKSIYPAPGGKVAWYPHGGRDGEIEAAREILRLAAEVEQLRGVAKAVGVERSRIRRELMAEFGVGARLVDVHGRKLGVLGPALDRICPPDTPEPG